jgi:hypothetical protein
MEEASWGKDEVEILMIDKMKVPAYTGNEARPQPY